MALKNHPKELWILALTEMCERYAFWGVGNLLVLFLLESYHFAPEKSTHIYGIFTGCAAFLPLVGGYIADRWNYQTPMLLGALVNALGCFLLATGQPGLLYPALAIIALGFGTFTPSILTLLGFAYRHKPELREAGFSIYYASINIGVFLALASLGSIAKLVSWNTAFFTAGCVQLVGLLPMVWYLRKHKASYTQLREEQKSVHHEKRSLTLVEKHKLWVIGIFCLFSIVFWMAYNQGFSSMEVFSHDFMNRTVLGLDVPEGIFLSSESLFLVILAPILAWLYAKLQRVNKDPSPATKTGLSLLFLAGCFLVMVVGTLSLPATATHANVSWTYLVGAYFLMAVGEMLLAPIGLSMVSTLAPARFTALLIGLWYVCVGLAFYLGGMLAGLMERVGGLFKFFSIFVVLAAVAGALMLLFSKKITRLAHGKDQS